MCFQFLPALAGLVGGGGAAGGAAAGGAAAGAGGAASAIGTAAQIAGLAAGAYGSIAAGRQANAVGEYNAQVAENNATASRNAAAYEAGITRDRVRQVIGAQRAAGASSGLDIQSGTPVAVLGDTAEQGELDVLARLYSGNAAATAATNDAALSRAQGGAQRQAGFINAGTNLLSGFGKMATASNTRYARYQPLGA